MHVLKDESGSPRADSALIDDREVATLWARHWRLDSPNVEVLRYLLNSRRVDGARRFRFAPGVEQKLIKMIELLENGRWSDPELDAWARGHGFAEDLRKRNAARAA